MVLQAPEKEQKMIAHACSVYQSLQTQRIAAEDSRRRLLSQAKTQRRIAKAKSSKAKLVKRHAASLISLAVEGLFAARENGLCSGSKTPGKIVKSFQIAGYISNNYHRYLVR